MSRFHVMNMPLLGALMLALAACVSSPSSRPALSEGTAWVAAGDEWADEARTVYAEATAWVTGQSRVHPGGSWAVVLDVDETILNNVVYQIEREGQGLGYTPESWHDWTQRSAATLVPGARTFIREVNRLDGHVALVTNRRDTEQLATELNLASVGLLRSEDFQVLLTRATPKGSGDKTSRFELVPHMLAAQGYPDVSVIAFVGDNEGDKPEDGEGWTFFCIDQGAMYGEPCADQPGPGQ